MNKSLYEQTGGTYEQNGDYILPNLELPQQKAEPISVWGCGCPVDTSEPRLRSTDRADRRDQRHGRYLKSHHKVLYYNYLTSGKLNVYLTDIDKPLDTTYEQHSQ